MAIKMLEILLNLSLILAVAFKGFGVSASSSDVIVAAGKPNVDCVALAEKQGKRWQTFNLPHESNCRKFYGCAQGTLVEMHCADMRATRFNPFTNRCDWDSEVECILLDAYLELIATHNCEY